MFGGRPRADSAAIRKKNEESLRTRARTAAVVAVIILAVPRVLDLLSAAGAL